MSTLFTPFVEHVLHGTPQDLGFITAAQAVGGIAGGMVAAASGRRIQAARLLCCGAVAFGLVDLAIFLSRLAGIIPVLAIQGGGYVVAGLAMLGWLRDSAGRPGRRTSSPADDIPADGDVSLTLERLITARSQD